MILWLFGTTLAAAVLRSIDATKVARGWADLKLSVPEGGFTDTDLVMMDRAMERGQLPPGWLVHKSGAAVQVLDPRVITMPDFEDNSGQEVRRYMWQVVGQAERQNTIVILAHANPSSETQAGVDLMTVVEEYDEEDIEEDIEGAEIGGWYNQAVDTWWLQTGGDRYDSRGIQKSALKQAQFLAARLGFKPNQLRNIGLHFTGFEPLPERNVENDYYTLGNGMVMSPLLAAARAVKHGYVIAVIPAAMARTDHPQFHVLHPLPEKITYAPPAISDLNPYVDTELRPMLEKVRQ